MTFIVSGALPGMGAVDLSSIGKEIGNTALATAAEAAANTKAFLINRSRIAAAAQLGYSGLDSFANAKPYIFLVSALGALGSGVGLMKRRKKSPETAILYSVLGAACLGSAWFTRPDWVLPPPQATTQVDPSAPGIIKQAIGAMDRRAGKLSATQPGWEGRTLVRLWGDLGSGTIPPVATTLLTKNAH